MPHPPSPDPSPEARRNALVYCTLRDEQFALYDAYAKRHGLSMKELLVLNALYYAKGGLTQREVCRRTLLSKQTVNVIVKGLLAAGHATLGESPTTDGRAKLVCMTDAGRASCGAVVRHITRAEDQAMAELDPADQQRLVDLSRTFTARLAELVNAEPLDTEEENPR